MNKKKKGCYFRVSIYTCLIMGYVLLMYTYGAQKKNINVSLTIQSTFSGNASLGDVEYNSGSLLFTCTTEQEVIIHANESSTWVIQGDIENLVAGSGTGAYTNTGRVTLESATDGNKNISIDLFRGLEGISTPPLSVILDTTPPDTPTLVYPGLNLNYNKASVYFQRSSSEDSSSGFKEYVLVLSNSPTFYTTQRYTTTQTSLSIDRNIIGFSNVYRRVEARDNTCNKSTSLPSFFKVQGVNSNTNENGNDDDNTNNTSNPPLTNPNEAEEGEHEVAWEYYTPHTYYEQHQYTKDTFIPLTGIKGLLRNKNIGVVLASKKKEFEQVYNASTGNPYQDLVMPGYLQKTGANPHEIIETISLLAKYTTSPVQREYLFSIIHQLLPNRTSGIILFLFILLYDIQFSRQRYHYILHYHQKRKKH